VPQADIPPARQAGLQPRTAGALQSTAFNYDY
jgi:hypothetical protein